MQISQDSITGELPQPSGDDGVRPLRRPRRSRPTSPPPAPPSSPEDNRFLAHLPKAIFEQLEPHLERVSLSRRQVLFRAHDPLQYVYFPTTAVVALIVGLESGQTLEVGLAGRDAFAGTAVLPWITSMACDGVVQIPGTGYRLSADIFRRELRASQALYEAVGRVVQMLHIRCTQMSVCNMFHSVDRRCVRWLLSVHDLLGTPDLPLTHDTVAVMLGVRRPTVTLVLRALHRAGLIDERRGHIIISDRRGLEAVCCECHGAMRAQQQRLLGY